MVTIEGEIILVIVILTLLLFLSPQTVSAEDESSMDISIIYPLHVNESFSFNVTIKSNNIPPDNVTVTFDGKTNRTDSFGVAGFVAPRVLPDGDNTYTIVALKEGYNATIAFNGKEYLSSINGTVTLTTPYVNKSKAYIISATKPGYIDYSIIITAYPLLSPENLVGFFIVIIICILIVVITFIIMLRKYLRRKRINRL